MIAAESFSSGFCRIIMCEMDAEAIFGNNSCNFFIFVVE